MDEIQLSDIQLDALKELGNIGAGHAATALSKMRNEMIDMTVPKVEVLPFVNMLHRVGKDDDEVVGVLLKVYGDVPGNLLYIMNYEKAKKFGEAFLGGYGEVSEEMFISLYQELGNILSNAYIRAIGDMTGLEFSTSVPAVTTDMLAAVFTTCFLDAEQQGDNVIAIDTRFIIDGNTDNGNGYFFYIPVPGTLKKILERLGLS